MPRRSVVRGLPSRYSRVEGLPPGGRPLPEGLRAACAEGRRIKDERETLLLRSEDPDGALWWKLYRVPLRRRLFAFLARSRARREGAALKALAASGIPVPELCCWAETRRLGILSGSLLVTREPPGARNLQELLLSDPDSVDARNWVRALGLAVRKLHDLGFVHFRLQLRNFLASGSPEHPRILVLDTPYTCRARGPAPRSRRLVDLVDLLGAGSPLPPSLAAEALTAYAGEDPPPARLNALRARSARAQKFRRIGWYLAMKHHSLSRSPR